ncbi:MAG: homocysteine S-methyltransferase family protein, partial [Mailhella sp.]
MTILEKIHSSLTYFDGGMGTLLQSRGLRPGELPETWNLSHPDDIVDIHSQYFEAGCNIITANTFGANCLKPYDLEPIIRAGLENAQKAASRFSGDRYIAYDIGSLGKMLQPLGDLPFEEAMEIFAKSFRIAA